MPAPSRSNGSPPITEWVRALRDQNHSAATELWESFRDRLESVAKRELAKLPQVITFDEEDVALSAFFTFCNHLQEGKFTALANREELWWLLIVITKRKAGEKVKHEGAARRSNEAGPVSLANPEFHSLPTTGMDPQSIVSMRENCDYLLGTLKDDELRMIAIWKLEGYTNDEIASRLMRTRQTVQRKLNLIRSIWASELQDE